jgi:Dimerisation domain of Zinc Transporter
VTLGRHADAGRAGDMPGESRAPGSWPVRAGRRGVDPGRAAKVGLARLVARVQELTVQRLEVFPPHHLPVPETQHGGTIAGPGPGRLAAQPWRDPVAGLAVTAFICHVGYEVTADVVHRLADGIDPSVITGAEAAAGSVPGVIHAHARARWTGRTLRIEIEGWVDPDMPVRDADELGRQVATALAREVPAAGSLTWTTRAAPA